MEVWSAISGLESGVLQLELGAIHRRRRPSQADCCYKDVACGLGTVKVPAWPRPVELAILQTRRFLLVKL